VTIPRPGHDDEARATRRRPPPCLSGGACSRRCSGWPRPADRPGCAVGLVCACTPYLFRRRWRGGHAVREDDWPAGSPVLLTSIAAGTTGPDTAGRWGRSLDEHGHTPMTPPSTWRAPCGEELRPHHARMARGRSPSPRNSGAAGCISIWRAVQEALEVATVDRGSPTTERPRSPSIRTAAQHRAGGGRRPRAPDVTPHLTRPGCRRRWCGCNRWSGWELVWGGRGTPSPTSGRDAAGSASSNLVRDNPACDSRAFSAAARSHEGSLLAGPRTRRPASAPANFTYRAASRGFQPPA